MPDDSEYSRAYKADACYRTLRVEQHGTSAPAPTSMRQRLIKYLPCCEEVAALQHNEACDRAFLRALRAIEASGKLDLIDNAWFACGGERVRAIDQVRKRMYAAAGLPETDSASVAAGKKAGAASAKVRWGGRKR